MNTREHTEMKMRGSADVSYLGRTVDEMVWEFMEEQEIPGLTLAIVQAPYIPRVVGYGFSDAGQKRLASVNTLWPAGPISQGYAAVAIMQLYEDGSVDLDAPAAAYVDSLPEQWKSITVRQLLHHASGLADYRKQEGFSLTREWTFEELIGLTADLPLQFEPGTEVAQSATNFLLLTEVVERVSNMAYQEFVKKNQFELLGLKHTSFSEGLSAFHQEDLSLSEYVHQIFKTDGRYIDPSETAVSYQSDGSAFPQMHSSALRGFGDVWASAQDISFWDIGLAGGVLIKKPEDRAVVYASWTLPDGPTLGRKIAGAFGDLLSTNYADTRLFLMEGQFSADETVNRLEKQLNALGIPVFAKFDHARNAVEAGLELRPTTVLVFGAPKVGTGLMQADQSIALELPLKIAVWEDEAGSTWLAFPKMKPVAEEYSLGDHPVIGNMQKLLERLVKKAANLYEG